MPETSVRSISWNQRPEHSKRTRSKSMWTRGNGPLSLSVLLGRRRRGKVSPSQAPSLSPLDIGELLDPILGLIDDPPTLARCARVNRTWFSSAVPHLWRGTLCKPRAHMFSTDWTLDPWTVIRLEPPTKPSERFGTPDLIAIYEIALRDPDRFRFYFSHVRYLQLSDYPPSCYPSKSRLDRHARKDKILLSPDLWTTCKPQHILFSQETDLLRTISSYLTSPTLTSIDFGDHRHQIDWIFEQKLVRTMPYQSNC